MVLNARRSELIKLLKDNAGKHVLTVEELARLFKVSSRTIRYDLHQVVSELTECGFQLQKQPIKGLCVEPIAEEGRKRHRPAEGRNNYSPSKGERKNTIIAYILDNEGPIAIDSLVDLLGVSRSTLLGDMGAVRRFLAERHLVLLSQRGVGFWIEGDEGQVRSVLATIFFGGAHRTNFSGQSTISTGSFESSLLQKYVALLPIGAVTEYLVKLFRENQLVMTDFSINYVIIALLVQVRRLQLGKVIVHTMQGGADDVCASSLFGVARKIALDLLSEYREARNEGEIAFITMQLLGAQSLSQPLLSGSTQEMRDDTVARAKVLAHLFVTSCQKWLGDVLSDDEELLSSHYAQE